MTPQVPLRHIGEAIIGLADDPHPPGSSLLQAIGGCYYLAIDNYYILYHIDDDGALTVLGVLDGPYHPLHYVSKLLGGPCGARALRALRSSDAPEPRRPRW